MSQKQCQYLTVSGEKSDNSPLVTALFTWRFEEARPPYGEVRSKDGVSLPPRRCVARTIQPPHRLAPADSGDRDGVSSCFANFISLNPSAFR